MSKAIVLFSGGLDSILAARLLEAQNIQTICVHFSTPFYGSPESVERWRKAYDLNIIARDIGPQFVEMLAKGPQHGFGKHLNPCVDCKIMIFSEAKKLMAEFGADFLASGEVIGQRPMSQRRDTLNLIQNKADVAGLLLRPLCAGLLQETLPEKNGLVDRSQLKSFSGRGRNPQLELAEAFKLTDIPSPAGGCRLTEKENSRRYWVLLKKSGARSRGELLRDFLIIRHGRVLFQYPDMNWLTMGRNRADNRSIGALATAEDLLLNLKDFPGPLALARNGSTWPRESLRQAAALLASYSPAAVKTGRAIAVNLRTPETMFQMTVFPDRQDGVWKVPAWEATHEELKNYRKKWLAEKKRQYADKNGPPC